MSTASPATRHQPPRRPMSAHPGPRRRSFGAWFADTGWRHLVAIVVSAFALFPLLYVVSASLNPKGTLTGSNQLFSAIGIDSYVRILSDPQNPYGTWFLNTLLIAVVTGAVTVFIGACAAYAFSRMRFAGRRVGLVTIVVVQMFPQLLAVVAIFLLMSTLGDWFPAIGLNTHTGLILVYLGGALGVNTYLMYGFFNTSPRRSTRQPASTGPVTRASSSPSSCAWSRPSSPSSDSSPSSARSTST